jgi:hypothetical protein
VTANGAVAWDVAATDEDVDERGDEDDADDVHPATRVARHTATVPTLRRRSAITTRA